MRGMFLAFSLLCLGTLRTVDAGTLSKGSNCSVTSQRLNLGTYQFYSECDSVTYCDAATGMCELKRCRKDVFPFGYTEGSELPPMCPSDKFCPDEEDQCLDLLPVDSPCQFNRDDQCQPPPNRATLKDTRGFGRNVNGALCLHNTCMWANASSGQACVVENTVFAVFGSDGHEYPDIVSRDNCKMGLYCDSNSQVCIDTKDYGATCSGNKECSSFNCLPSGACGLRTDTPVSVDKWVYAVVGGCGLVGVVGTICVLLTLHKKERNAARRQRVQYWEEQNWLRQSFLSMQEAAHTPLGPSSTGLRLPVNASSSYYDVLHKPALQSPSRPVSGLRYTAVSNDGTDSLPGTPRIEERSWSPPRQFTSSRY